MKMLTKQIKASRTIRVLRIRSALLNMHLQKPLSSAGANLGGGRGWRMPKLILCQNYNREPLVVAEKTAPTRGGFRGGGGRSPPPQGFDPLPTQRVPPLILFKKSIFGRPTLKFF